MITLSRLSKRCVELSFRFRLTHVSSVLNTVDLIDEIYSKRKENEPFVQGNGHAALAHYVVLEKHGLCDAEEMIVKHGTHASRDMEHGIWCSNGSLGQAETVAVGMALADKTRTVWLVTSDGACMEGSVYEALRIIRRHCPNLILKIVFNGFGAYGHIREDDLPMGGVLHWVNQNRYPEWLRGLPGHYLVLNETQYLELMS